MGWTLAPGNALQGREHIVLTAQYEGIEYCGELPSFGIVMNRRVLKSLQQHVGMWLKGLGDIEVLRDI